MAFVLLARRGSLLRDCGTSAGRRSILGVVASISASRRVSDAERGRGPSGPRDARNCCPSVRGGRVSRGGGGAGSSRRGSR